MANDVDLKVGATSSGVDVELTKVEQNFANSIQRMQRTMQEMQSNMKSISSSVNRDLGSMQTSSVALGSAVGTLLANGIGYALGQLKSLGSGTFKIASDFEMLSIQLKAVMGSAESGKEAFEWIKQMAVNTPYGVEQLAQAFIMLRNFGLNPMDGTLQKVSDAAGKYGRDMQAITGISLALGQAWARGKLQGQDIMQMIDGGLPVWSLLEQATGKTTAQLQEMSEKGQITRTMMRQLIDEMGKQSAGAAADKMNSMSGAISNMEDSYANAIDKIRQKGGFDFISTSIQGVSQVIPDFVGVFGEAAAVIQAVLGTLNSVFSVVMNAIVSIVQAAIGRNSETATAFDVLSTLFKAVEINLVGLRVGFQISMAIIKGAINEVVNVFYTFGMAVTKIFRLDFNGFNATIQQGMNNAKAIVTKSTAEIVALAKQGNADLSQIVNGDPKKTPNIDTKTPAGSGTGGTGSTKGQATRLQTWRSELEAMLEAEQNYFKDSLAEEIAFWEKKRALTKAGSSDRASVDHELFTLRKKQAQQALQDQLNDLKLQSELAESGSQERVRIAQETARKIGESYGFESREYKTALAEIQQAERAHQQVMRNLRDMEIENRKAASLNDIEIQEQNIKTRKDLGQITATQELQMLLDLENQKYQIEYKAAQDKIALIHNDVIEQQRAYDKLEGLSREHAKTVSKINNDMEVAQRQQWQKYADPVINAVQTSIQGIIQGTTTLRKAMANIFQSIALEFINMGVKMVASWAMDQVRMTMATSTGAATRAGIETAASAQSAAASGGNALISIMNDAYKAMAGAYSAIAGIPYVGPFLAPAVAAGAFASVAGLAGSVLSAEGGFDIPAGINPMVQTHEKEMILPAEHAETIRGLSAGNNGGAIHLHTQGGDFVHKNDVAALVRKLNRNFVIDNSPFKRKY